MLYNKTKIYNGSGRVYNSRGVYNSCSVYNGGGVYAPDGLISLFYGDFENNDYKFRYTSNDVYLIRPNAGNATTSYAINESRIENTPLGEIPIFKYGDPNAAYFLMAYFNPNSFKYGSFTTDFWFYCKPSDYNYGGNSRFIASQLRIMDVSANSIRNLNFGPWENWGVYYNLTDGANQISIKNINEDWHHIEIDFDYTNKKLYFYLDGTSANRNVASTPLYTLFESNDYFHASRVTNDSRNNPNVKITQLALWNKLMSGDCYSMGLYHDGQKFLI